MKKILLVLLVVIAPSFACAYDAVFTYTQSTPELVAGWKIKAGPTKGGPYHYAVDCKKPAPNLDGTYDCTDTGLTANPIYAIAVNYNSAGVESAISNEATMTVTVPPPASLKIGVKITTVSRINSRGNVVATTTIKRIESTEPIKEGTASYQQSS